MMASWCRVKTALSAGVALTFLIILGGCQSGTPVSSRQLIQHQALIDFSGLKVDEPVPWVKASIGAPRTWEVMPTQSNALFTHQQWRSPSTHTGVGIVYAHLPLPVSAKSVVWLAKQQFSKKSPNGKVVDEWVDPLGRSWFQAQNEKYRIRGYVVVKGLDAWVIYFGYRVKYSPDLGEISLAARSAETAVPMLDEASEFVHKNSGPQAAPLNGLLR